MAATRVTTQRRVTRWRWPGFVLLGASLLFNAAFAVMAVHYRVPPRIWRLLEPKPAQSVRFDLKTPLPPAPLAKLGFTAAGGEADPAAWRTAARRKLSDLLAIEPVTGPPATHVVQTDQFPKFTRESLVFDMPDGMQVPAFRFVPERPGRHRAVLLIPGFGWGISAAAGLVDDPLHAAGVKLAQDGFVVVAMELRGFGYLQEMGPADARVDFGPYGGDLLIRGKSAMGQTVQDALCVVEDMVHDPEIDPDAIGVLGFSVGGRAAIYAAALDQRIQAVAASSCVEENTEVFRFSLQDRFSAVPGIANWLAMGDCIGIVAPRPLLAQWGASDTDRSQRTAAYNPSSMACIHCARPIYAAFGASTMPMVHVSEGMGHEVDVAAIAAFLREHLPEGSPQPAPSR